MIRITPFIPIIGISLLLGCASEKNLDQILAQGSSEFQEILSDPRYEIQIIYGRIKENGIDHQIIGDTGRYFYPASSVKMLAAFAAAKKMEELSMPLEAEILVDSSEHHPRALHYDSLFQEALTIEKLIQKIFVYSDNQAFNILYGWLGKDYINSLYLNVGLETRITHQLSENAFSFTPEANASTTVVVLKNDGNFVKSQARNTDWESALNPSNQMKGTGYLKEDSIINQPFAFNEKNYAPLLHLLGSLEQVIYPGKCISDLGLSADMRSKLKEIMAMRPKDLPEPIKNLGDNYAKFFMYGENEEDKSIPDHIQILNKVGWAYGYLTDVAYIKDTQNNIEFFLAATIHVNENQIYNDGVYEYEEIGLPFLTELGNLIYNHELNSN